MTQVLELATTPLEGTLLIEASAGTGKTYTLTGLFARLLLEKKLTVDQILVVTFTEAATEELRAGIRTRLKELTDIFRGKKPALADWEQTLVQRYRTETEGLAHAAHVLELALRNFDLAQIFTIHGFCQRILGQNGFECRILMDTELVPDLTDLSRQVCVDYWREHILPLDGLTGKAVRQKLSPDTLVKLANLPFLAQPFRIVPHFHILPDTQPWEEEIHTACTKLLKNWDNTCLEVRQVFLSRANTLHKGKFSKDKLENWLASVHSFLQNPALDPDDGLVKLGQAYVNTMATQKSEPPQHSLFMGLDELAQTITDLNTHLDHLVAALQAQFLRQFLRTLDQRKQLLGVQGFDDLLRNVHDALQYPELRAKVRSQYQAALIDEFQDTDGLQYDIFRTLFAFDPNQASLFFIGDPKQAIYSFRGADLHTYLEAAQGCTLRLTLGTNYRSTPELIAAINNIFSRPANPFLNQAIQYQPVGAADRKHQLFMDHSQVVPPLTIWQIHSENKPLPKNSIEKKICQAVTGEISRLLTGAAQGLVSIGPGKLTAGDIAVLVETNTQGLAMHKALAQMGIASVTTHNASVWSSAEAGQLLSVLYGIVHCQNQKALRTALAMPLLGLTAPDLEQLDKKSHMLEEWFERFFAYRDLWEQRGIMAATQRLLSELQVRPRLVALPQGERRLTNVLHLLELLQAQERQTHLSMHSLLAWFQKQFQQAETEDAQLRLDTDRNAVQIVTIHKSKGLEYPVVFCPFVYKQAGRHDGLALVHDQSLLLDLGSEQLEDRQKQALMEDQGEKIRLLYVALTRARAKCYLVWGRINQAETSGAAWLFHGHRATDSMALSWGDMSEDMVTQDLQQLVCPEIEVSSLPDQKPQPVREQTSTTPDLSLKIWNRTLGTHAAVSSFTGLTRGTEYLARPGLDEDDAPGLASEAWTMANFPRGATAGTCLHQIFEHIDFTRPETIAHAVSTALSDHGFDSLWQEPVQDMVQAVLTADLQGFCLKDIDQKNRMVELEFLFPLRPITFETLALAYTASAQLLPPNLAEQVHRLRFEPRQGYLIGFADLIVRFDNRFYLLDWKSNWLGPDPKYYTRDVVEQAMAENLYFLQYHLYCLALNRYLTQRIPDYDPFQDFGGVRYLFLRGIDPKVPGQGVYADLPEPRFLALLDQTLIPGEQP